MVVAGQLRLDLSQDGFLLRESVGAQLGGVGGVGGDLGALGQQVVALVVQALVRVGADHVGRAAVGVIGGVPFLSVRHGQVLGAEGGHGLALAHAHRPPARDGAQQQRVQSTV